MTTTSITSPPTAAQAQREDLAKLLLRLALGVLILLHGIAKLGSGPGFVQQALAGAGLPGFIAYGVYVGEIVAPLLLIVGLWTRLGALIVVGNMLMAVFLVHLPQLATRNETGGWALELQGMYFFTALALVLLGAGRYSVGGRAGRFN